MTKERVLQKKDKKTGFGYGLVNHVLHEFGKFMEEKGDKKRGVQETNRNLQHPHLFSTYSSKQTFYC